MTAADIEKKIINLLGYTDGSGNIAPNAHLKQRALTAINTVYADLFYALGRTEFSPVTAPEDKINLPERIRRGGVFSAERERRRPAAILYNALQPEKGSAYAERERRRQYTYAGIKKHPTDKYCKICRGLL